MAAHFGVAVPPGLNAPDEAVPGCPGLVVRETDGRRVLESMIWDFPRAMISEVTGPPIKPKPVNNIADLDNAMWRGIAPAPRGCCLIPASYFAEAEGAIGARTRTWFSVDGEPVAAWARLWRVSGAWRPVHAGLMTDANDAVRPVHHRMPVLLLPDDYDRWLRGRLADVAAFQARRFADDRIVVDRTADRWNRRPGNVAA